MAGRLTTHVLDTAQGRPAAGLRVQLYLIEGAGRRPLVDTVTNADGRTDGPLLDGEALEAGTYELIFRAGDYLRAAGLVGKGIVFLDRIPIRFGIADPAVHYHVPLLLSPYGYSTYRGS